MKMTDGSTVRSRTVEVTTAVVTVLAASLIAYAIWALPAPAVARGTTEKHVAAWAAKESVVDTALIRRDMAAAALAAEEAYRAAIATRSWEALVAVGDDYAELARLSGDRETWLPRARSAYLRALFRARATESAVGALRVAEAFAALGDRDPVRESLRMAEKLSAATDDPALRRSIASLAERTSVNLERGRVAAFLERLTGAVAN
jgi:hypothetical protein